VRDRAWSLSRWRTTETVTLSRVALGGRIPAVCDQRHNCHNSTYEMVTVVHRRPCLQHLACCSVNSRLRIAISAYPTCIRRPRWVPVRILICRLASKNQNGVATRWWKKFWWYVYSFWHNSRTWQTDGPTDRRTDIAWWHRPRLHSIARQKQLAFTIGWLIKTSPQLCSDVVLLNNRIQAKGKNTFKEQS